MILMIGKCNNGTCEYCGEEGTAKYQIISVIFKKKSSGDKLETPSGVFRINKTNESE